MSVFEYQSFGGTGEDAATSRNTGASRGFENIKNSIADQLKTAAEMLDEKSKGEHAQSGIGQYGKQASEWLDQSAGYVRQFDYEEAEASIRECIKQHPGRSLLIAGAVGLIIGVVLRRR